MEYTYEQDAADFYLYEGDTLSFVVSYPHGVGLDFAKAMKARDWFKAKMRELNIKVRERDFA